ncbi:MAG: UDP-N-acetylmuramoyl-tripeptide--D-alanyl-D-alanine ligase, partial [Desulfobulbaceae bacterium]|nr:UDP-N-acetylmuramoyl-tripeptide--D-alanyl-D-alanine ligase [Desulfobulbaceae bacterium]
MELATLSRVENSRSVRKQNIVAVYNGDVMDRKSAWTLSQVLLATDGRFVSGESEAEARFHSISTDTRTLASGDLFLALSGDHFDGQQFLEEAVQKGAA